MATGAVITADIANYTLLSKPAQKKLINLIHLLAKAYKIEFYRGDSFQVYLKHPGEALKLILNFRTAAKAIDQTSMKPAADVRAGIGIGQVNTPVRAIKTATGEAFILSGRGFDGMVKSKQRLIIQSELPSLNQTLKVIASFTDYLMDQLTSKQAEVVFELLNHETQLEAARKLHKSQATISQHVQSAGWTEIVQLLDNYAQLTAQFK
jgi:hypothetical protein